MYEVVEEMMDYIHQNNLNLDYLISIGIPIEVINEIPIIDKSGFKLKINLMDYLDEIAEQMESFLFDEINNGEEKSFNDIRLAKMLNKFNLPVCPFWLTFCELVKVYYINLITI